MKLQKCRQKNIIMILLAAFFSIQISLISLSGYGEPFEKKNCMICSVSGIDEYTATLSENCIQTESCIYAEPLPKTGRHTTSNNIALLFLIAAVLFYLFSNPKH